MKRKKDESLGAGLQEQKIKNLEARADCQEQGHRFTRQGKKSVVVERSVSPGGPINIMLEQREFRLTQTCARCNSEQSLSVGITHTGLSLKDGQAIFDFLDRG